MSFILIAAVMIAMFWLFDVRGLQILRRQSAAESFPSVPGRIMESDVVTWTSGRGGTHYRAAFTYRYLVNGTGYRCQRYRYDNFPADADAVSALVAALPIGSEVSVYYNPEHPNDAVLSPRVEAEDVYRLFFQTPLGMILPCFLLKACWQMNRPSGRARFAGGVMLLTERLVTRVRLPQYSPALIALIVTGILSLLAGILIYGHIPAIPPLAAGAWALALVLLGGLATYGWLYFKIASGKRDLVIDAGARTVRLPLTYKRWEQPPLAFTEVKAVRIKRVPHRSRGGVFYTYATMIHLASGKSECLTEMSQRRGKAFAVWLREKLGVSAKS